MTAAFALALAILMALFCCGLMWYSRVAEERNADSILRMSINTVRQEFIDEALQREGYSRVTFELEPLGREVKLTVVHDDMPEGSLLFRGISNGWPKSLASLKTLLETGRPLDVSSAEAGKPGEAEVVAMARGGA